MRPPPGESRDATRARRRRESAMVPSGRRIDLRRAPAVRRTPNRVEHDPAVRARKRRLRRRSAYDQDVAATATASRRSQIANEDFATLARPTNECVPDFDIAPSPKAHLPHVARSYSNVKTDVADRSGAPFRIRPNLSTQVRLGQRSEATPQPRASSDESVERHRVHERVGVPMRELPRRSLRRRNTSVTRSDHSCAG